MPLAVETLGPWGEDAKKLIRDIGRRIEANSGEKRATSFLFQRLGVAIQRGDATAVLGTIPRSSRLNEIFILS